MCQNYICSTEISATMNYLSMTPTPYSVLLTVERHLLPFTSSLFRIYTPLTINEI